VAQNQGGIDRSVDNLQAITTDIKGLLHESRPQISTIMGNASELTARAITIAQRADSITASLKDMMADIENGKGSVGMLLKDDAFYRTLKTTVAGLDTLVGDVNDNGLKLRIKIGFKKEKKK
jgi:phospholipid/cholesterol/gamma-HCH transport system substrate-binding protein